MAQSTILPRKWAFKMWGQKGFKKRLKGPSHGWNHCFTFSYQVTPPQRLLCSQPYSQLTQLTLFILKAYTQENLCVLSVAVRVVVNCLCELRGLFLRCFLWLMAACRDTWVCLKATTHPRVTLKGPNLPLPPLSLSSLSPIPACTMHFQYTHNIEITLWTLLLVQL